MNTLLQFSSSLQTAIQRFGYRRHFIVGSVENGFRKVQIVNG